MGGPDCLVLPFVATGFYLSVCPLLAPSIIPPALVCGAAWGAGPEGNVEGRWKARESECREEGGCGWADK